MYIVIETENHPGACISEIFGPFDTPEKADAFCKRASEHTSNVAPSGHRFRRYTTHPVTSPEHF